MRIAYVVSRYPSTTETFIAREMSALRDKGVEIELYALVSQGNAVRHPESLGFDAHTAPLLSGELIRAQLHWLRRSPRRYLAAWWQALIGNARSGKFLARTFVVVPTAAWFAVEVERGGIDHVHAHWATHSALAAWIVNQLTGCPYSITAHAHDIFVDQSMLERKLDDATFVAVISEFNASFLTERYPSAVKGKLAVVRCGVDPAAFRPLDGTPDGTPDGDCVHFVCVASLQDYKGHRFLVDALRILGDRGIGARLDLVGDGEMRVALEAQVAGAGIADRVRFHGSLPSDAVSTLLRSCDVFVLPSVVTTSGKMEGIPVALMEAGGVGLPVVASRLSGIPELVMDQESGLLVKPGDAVALADAMEILAVDPDLRRRMGEAGRRRVLDEFTVSLNADRLLSMLMRMPAPAEDVDA